MRRGLVVVSLLGAAATPAAADGNDIVLSRLATLQTDSSGVVIGATGQNRELRALSSQLGVVLAPHLLTPADTLGFGGFQFDVDVSQTSIDSTQPYWRAREGSTEPAGSLPGTAHGPGALRTIGVTAHKGLWLPVPSFELGAGAVHV